MDWFRRNWRALSFVGGLIGSAGHRHRAGVWWIPIIPAGTMERGSRCSRHAPRETVCGYRLDPGPCAGGFGGGLRVRYSGGPVSGLSPSVSIRLSRGSLHALRSVPASALFPLFLIVAGVGETSIVALAAYPSLLVVLVNAVSGAALANQSRLDQARLLNLNSWAQFQTRFFTRPCPASSMAYGLQFRTPLVLVVAVETVHRPGERGLGRGIYLYQSSYRIPETYGAIMIAGMIGILLNWVVTNFSITCCAGCRTCARSSEGSLNSCAGFSSPWRRLEP